MNKALSIFVICTDGEDVGFMVDRFYTSRKTAEDEMARKAKYICTPMRVVEFKAGSLLGRTFDGTSINAMDLLPA